jgi:hypothetical protein
MKGIAKAIETVRDWPLIALEDRRQRLRPPLPSQAARSAA